MKTECMKPDELRPAKAKASAGRKSVPMTDEEKQRQRERLLAISEEEKNEAMDFLGRFITKTIKKWGFDLRNGPFCYDELQGEAKDVVSYDSYCAIYVRDGGQAPVPSLIISELGKNTPISTEIGDK